MIFDIIIVVLLLLTIFIGYKVGFGRALIKIASLFTGLLAAIFLARPFGSLLYNMGAGTAISNNIFANITAKDAYINMTSGTEGLANFFTELGVPSFLANVLSTGIQDSFNPEEIVRTVSNNLAYAFLCVISFFAILVLSGLVFLICKLIIRGLRNHVTAFRIIDGIFGIIVFVIFYMLIIYLLLLILSLLLQLPGFANSCGGFINGQLHIGTNKFGITKYLYEHNIIGNLLKLFF